MKLIRIINKFFAYLYFLAKYFSHSVAFAFANNNIPLKATSYVYRKGNNLLFGGNNSNSLPIRLVRHFNYPQLHYIISLLNNKNIFVTDVDKGRFTLKCHGVTYPIASQLNLAVIYELLFENSYNVFSARSCVLLDIGMNVGYVSLYYAGFPSVKKIYSYEPFEETFQIAIQNLALNETLSKKIKANNYGISSYTGNVDVPLLERGSIIASTEKSFIKDLNIQSSKSITVRVRDILEVLEEIKQENPDQLLALKIDCEGEEYNILETLNKNHGFDKIIFLCIEWHLKGPELIREILRQNNFTVFDTPINREIHGMIYGFRTDNS